MLIDDVKIEVKAGHGGDGNVAFNKTKMTLGPTGGNGGAGGSVYFEGTADLSVLAKFRYKKDLIAPDGAKGGRQLKDGIDGKDLLFKVPVGTVVHNLSTNKAIEIAVIGQRLLVALGGKGGKGNFMFRSSLNTSPEEFQEGLLGEECELRLELKLIADVGFIGLPNVGKSSWLNCLTNAQSKVANYPFTTLEPNLGVYFELILADIPGLIEGASLGKGLGIKFLRHIERTKTLFHFISAESLDPLKDYQIIKNELSFFNQDLLKRAEYIFLNKADMVSQEELAQKLNKLKVLNKEVIPVSSLDDKSILQVEKILRQLIKQKSILDK
ncbi:GTPase ObgE [bacterium (Candidatus Gribaldobacteria) CG10_big_fil_rev_8_21_14_0_10_37_21]|uniref:GTPase Obg n=1 Tax=bacterium (Candidatus Gribaldobacteria) CG10_big_fil_rev_8_21_14_0_10_37_21 TaxID=2014275 RepID=A0A2H0UWL9_9BACT|nr:MAG: GTPase ObgE [bacterium (Candidatus Gribaldobacteria) CG10_big_fil_rev_8_21_14_0_10_37_21]